MDSKISSAVFTHFLTNGILWISYHKGESLGGSRQQGALFLTELRVLAKDRASSDWREFRNGWWDSVLRALIH